nr:MAG TPA: hypothetical protein [Caudoviricetes sp.]
MIEATKRKRGVAFFIPIFGLRADLTMRGGGSWRPPKTPTP